MTYSQRFFTSDHHFGHKNILKYEAQNRPFKSVEEMDQNLIERWNQTVGPNDEVYYLGDFTFKSDVDSIRGLLHSLNGKKYLIQGNHDRSILQDCGFEWMKNQEQCILLDQKGRQDPKLHVLLCHYPYVDRSFLHMDMDSVLTFSSLGSSLETYFTQSIEELELSHRKDAQSYLKQRQFLIAYYGLNLHSSESNNPEVDALKKYLKKILKRMIWRQPRPQGQWLLHGHVHGLWQSQVDQKMINVSVEAWDLKPVREQILVDLILASESI